MPDPVLLQTPLADRHRAAGAKMIAFGPWLMPLEYQAGTLAEHAAVRGSVGIFDVSHMGRLLVQGPDALAALNQVVASDLSRIRDGQAQYSLLCNEAGGVIDDLIVYRISAERLLVVPNAGNTAAVRSTLGGHLNGVVELVDLGSLMGIIAVQGPQSAQLLATLGLLADPDELPYMAVGTRSFGDSEILLARTGYTGERGYELIAPALTLGSIWDQLSAHAQPVGLGARDTLRLEMGYPLHGNELAPDSSPLLAGLSWVIGWDKPAFPGRAALLAQRAAGMRRTLRGLRLTGRGVPRAGMSVLDQAGNSLGEVTSGNFSPTLRTGIALARLAPDAAVGDEVQVVVRSRPVPAQVVATPFVTASPK